MKELSILLLVSYSIYVGYFLGVNKESLDKENILMKFVAICFSFCSLWIALILDCVIYIKKQIK